MSTNDAANNEMAINFFHKLREKKSESIVNELQSFINFKFSEVCEQSKNINMIAIALQEFISKMIAEFAKMWHVEFTNNRDAYAEISDGFESLITKCLYHQLISYFAEEKKLEKLYRKYSFINLKHLGFDFILDEIDLVTQLKYFVEIANLKSPKEKSLTLVNLCNYISIKYNLSEKFAILKFLVFCFLKANVPNLKSHLKYIQIFRHITIFSSEEDYYCSVAIQAVEFIEKMNYHLLKLTKEEFSSFVDEYDKREILKSPYRNNDMESNLLFYLNKNCDENFMLDEKNSKLNGPLLENINDGVLNMNTERLYNEYYSNNFNENSVKKYENLYNDLKISLKMIESLKNEYKIDTNRKGNVNQNTKNSTMNI